MVLLIALVLAVIAPIMAKLFYFALSRKREYLADASAVRLTRYPHGLASALEKIALSSRSGPSPCNRIMAPMFIVNPLAHEGGESGLFSTHPPLFERVAILRSMTQDAGYAQYEREFIRVKGKRQRLVPASGLIKNETVSIRSASPETLADHTPLEDFREVADLIYAVEGYTFLTCSCGLKVKIPPQGATPIQCVRCGQTLTISTAVPEAQTKPRKPQNLTYTRRTKEWESFHCACGHLLELSPVFQGSRLICSICGSKIKIQTSSDQTLVE